MFEPWITIPANDVHISLPISIYEGNIKIMFRDENAIDKTIEQLQYLREFIKKEGLPPCAF